MLSIKDARKRAGLTQKQLADAMGVSRAAVSSWERQSAPSTKRIRKLARVLGCDAEDLLPPDQDTA